MEDYLIQIEKYLPVGFKEEETKVFVKYLSSAYMDNLKNEKYQFAFTAFHMLYMSYIYKVKWFLKLVGNETLSDTIKNHTDYKNNNFNDFFDFSIIKEATSLEKVLQSLCFDGNQIKDCKHFVDYRNNCSHAAGKIYYQSKDIDYFITKELENISNIQKKITPDINKYFSAFIKDNWNKKFIQGDIKNWIIENHFSAIDLEIMLNYELPLLSKKSDKKDIVFQKILYLSFISVVIVYLDYDENILISKLKCLNDLSDSINVTDIKGDQAIYKTKMDIFNQDILPLFQKFTGNDLLKIASTLNLT